MSRQIQHLTRAHSQSSSSDVRSVFPTGDLLGRSGGELRGLMLEIGEPTYRGAQLYHALYAERRLDFASMSNLPAALRRRLANDFHIGVPEISQRFRSSDGSLRYLLTLSDAGVAQRAGQSAARVEAVFMPSD